MQVKIVWRTAAVALFALAPSLADISDAQSTSTNPEPATEAATVAHMVTQSYMEVYDKHDPHAIAMLYVPDGVLLPPNGAPIAQGREAIERAMAGLFKSLGGHEAIRVKTVIPAGENALVAITEFKIVGDGPNSGKMLSGRAAITLVKTPAGWKYVAIAPQTKPPASK